MLANSRAADRHVPLPPPRPSPSLPPEYVRMLAQDGHHNLPAFLHAVDGVFGDVDLRGRRVLEIGSGRGLMAMLMALRGAAQVVSLEPELVGSTCGVIAEQRARLRRLRIRNVEVVAADFNTWDPGDARFDVILSKASLNHLHFSEHHALRDASTHEAYARVASTIHALLAPGGVFIATDACRYAFFTAVRDLGIRRPWRPQRTGVNWRHHQNPGTWKRIFSDAGFARVEVRYPVPHRLRHVSLLVDTAAANFMLNGTFILRAYRAERS
jgi:SAM-dependent methyltransferase